jgi:hypothetical protein
VIKIREVVSASKELLVGDTGPEAAVNQSFRLIVRRCRGSVRFFRKPARFPQKSPKLGGRSNRTRVTTSHRPMRPALQLDTQLGRDGLSVAHCAH